VYKTTFPADKISEVEDHLINHCGFTEIHPLKNLRYLVRRQVNGVTHQGIFDGHTMMMESELKPFTTD